MTFGEKIRAARAAAQADKIAHGGSIYGNYILRPLTIYLSYPLAQMGVSAHAVTVIMCLIGLAGSVLMVFDRLWFTVAAALCWQLWVALDHVDGEVARLRRKTSQLGVYLDNLNHIFIESTFSLALGIHVCIKDFSLLNLAVTGILYSSWHWKNQIRRASEGLLHKGGFNLHQLTGTHQPDPKSPLTWLRFILVKSVSEHGPLFLVPAAILFDYFIAVDFALIFLYGYTLMVLGYMAALILHDGFAVHRFDQLQS